MPTITKAALQWYQDEMESVISQRDELEEELEAVLEENQALRLQITQLMSDRSLRD